MRYVLGIDGGGSKTDLMLCREDGECCGFAVEGGSNHQLVGLEKAQETLLQGMDRLLRRQGVDKEQLIAVCLGLSGADLPEDIRALEAILAPWCRTVPCRVLNDVWLPLAAMVPAGPGAVSICGTGHNTAVRGTDGRRYQIAALTYTLGNWGGGHMMVRQAMHAAIRAAEHTGERTGLTEALPAAYGFRNMTEVQRHFYLAGEKELYSVNVPEIVSCLARDGDAVCIRLLENDGRIQAEMTSGLLEQAGLLGSEPPVVLAGSLYLRDVSGRMREAYQAELLKRCPGAKVMTLDRPPVTGAVLLALRDAGLLNRESEQRVLNTEQRESEYHEGMD